MILKFSDKTKHEKNALIGEGYFYLQEAARLGKSLEIVEVKPKRSLAQNAGYWRICTLLAPHIQEQYGEIIDKEEVSNTAKLAIGYSVKIGKQASPRSLTKATKEQMNLLIEKLYEMCEFFNLKNYELTSAETQALVKFFNKKEG